MLTLLHSERPKLHRVLAVLSAIGLRTCLGFEALAQAKPLENLYNYSKFDKIFECKTKCPKPRMSSVAPVLCFEVKAYICEWDIIEWRRCVYNLILFYCCSSMIQLIHTSLSLQNMIVQSCQTTSSVLMKHTTMSALQT